MEPLYAVAGILGLWLASLAAAFAAGRATLADDERAQRDRADRAEALAESRRLALVEADKRAARTAAGLQRMLDRKAERLDVVHGEVGVGPDDLRAALDLLLSASGRGEGGPDPEAGAGAGSAEGHGSAAQGVGPAGRVG